MSVEDRSIGPTSPGMVVVVRGLDHACWKCGGTTTCIIAVHLAGSGRSEDWVWFEDKPALRFARELLVQAGQLQRAATIKDRFRKTAGGSYLFQRLRALRCHSGDWPLGRSISDYALDTPLEELPILVSAAVAEAAWHEVAVNQGMHPYGYPMTWEDID